MRHYGLIGHPLGHSFSARFFADKFAAEGIDACYDNYDLNSIDEVRDLWPRLAGFNVTIPYKQDIIPYLSSMSEEAQAIGAVNVVRVSGDQLHGYNTDVIGFRESLRPLLQPWHTHALVLGTGGASKAVCHALNQLGIAWTYVSRTPRPGYLTYEQLRQEPQHIAESLLIVNCSPLGTYPHIEGCPDIPYDRLTPRHLCYDLVYNPERTRYMELASAQGASVKNGLEMLHLQALAAWDIWNRE